jgi:hypothetical protein
LWKRVEEDRLREERLRKPYLIAFRATQEEIEMRKAEDAQETAFGEMEFERLARLGREEVRFQRYLIRQGSYPKIPKDATCSSMRSATIIRSRSRARRSF